MKTLRLRLCDVTIKINVNHYKMNDNGGFKRFYKDLDYWCDAIICEPIYHSGTVLECFEPNCQILEKICEEIQQSGRAMSVRKEKGEPLYFLTDKKFFDDENETYN